MVENCLWRSVAQLKLRTHLLEFRSKRIDLLLLPRNCRFCLAALASSLTTAACHPRGYGPQPRRVPGGFITMNVCGTR
jgi:hypothetical protein